MMSANGEREADRTSKAGSGEFITLLQDVMIVFPTVVIGLIFLSFILGIAVTSWQAPVGVILSLTISFSWNRNRSPAKVLGVAVAFIALCAAAMYIESFFVDEFHDSRQYHGTAVIAFKDGWNPVETRLVKEWDEAYASASWKPISYFPKSQWMLRTALYATVGDLDASKCPSILMWILLCIMTHAFLRRTLGMNRWISILATITIVTNPVIMTQLFTGYVDGTLATVFTLYVILMIDYVMTGRRKRLHQSAWLLCYLIGLKFTGLVYVVVFCFCVFLLLLFKNRRQAGSCALISTLSGVIAFAAFGYNPYITNIIEDGNPFYYAYSPGKPDVLNKMADRDFLEQNRIMTFIISYASVSDPKNAKSPRYFWSSDSWEYRGPDARFGGFGPFYLIFVAVGLVLILLVRVGWGLWAVSFCLATVFITSACWWARLAPQAWLIPCISMIAVYGKTDGKVIKTLVVSMMIMALGNSAMITTKNWTDHFRRSTRFHQDVAYILKCEKPVPVNVSGNRRMAIYNKRKVDDLLGENIVHVEGKRVLSRNGIFGICKE